MAQYTIFINDTDFYYIQRDTIHTECADIYTFDVYATNGDDIDITVTSNAINEEYILDGTTSTFTDTDNITYGNSLQISFAIENSGNPGVFDSAILTLDNNTTSQSLSIEVTRENDNLKCECCDESGSFVEINDLTAAVVWDDVPDDYITESSVTQHQAALSITESQISDLSHFSGNYNDLINTPDLGDLAYLDESDLNYFTPTDLLTDYGVTLSTVAITNDYNDLDNLPSVLQSGDNISELINDSGYITSADGGDAATLDGINSSSFLRNDIPYTDPAQTIAGSMIYAANARFTFGNEFQLWSNSSEGRFTLLSSNLAFRVGSTEVAKLYTNGNFELQNNLLLQGIPTYADDTAAGSGGLTSGYVYKTSTGELRIKL